LEREIQRVTAAIESVAAEIQSVNNKIAEAEANAAAAINNERERDYWREKENKLRDELKQLREKENKLRDEKNKLMDKEEQLRGELKQQSQQPQGLQSRKMESQSFVGHFIHPLFLILPRSAGQCPQW